MAAPNWQFTTNADGTYVRDFTLANWLQILSRPEHIRIANRTSARESARLRSNAQLHGVNPRDRRVLECMCKRRGSESSGSNNRVITTRI